MRWLISLQVVWLLSSSVLSADRLDEYDVWKKIKEKVKDGEDVGNFYDFVNKLTNGKMFNFSVDAHKILEEEGHSWPPLDPAEIPKFNCLTDMRPKERARTVHELTPYDVEIVAAFGDSITAAFGALAYTPIDLFIEYHGVSWSIGGDGTVRDRITLPNIIKEYSKNLTGFAKSISPPLLPIPNEHLDVAVSGATSYGLQRQAERLMLNLLLNPKYDFFGSWKVLTLFIGGNDLCSCCTKKEKYKPENFVKGVRDVLDYLHERVPKMFVNLVTPPNVTILQDLSSPWCDFTHLLECRCGSVYGKKARKFTSGVLLKYQELYSELIESGRYDTRDDFTVVLQPFFDNTIVPRKPNGLVDRTFFAPDCFHFSGKGHQASALALWNSMLEPVGKKSKTWRPNEIFHCPTKENPYFFTAKNSKTFERQGKQVKENQMRENIQQEEIVIQKSNKQLKSSVQQESKQQTFHRLSSDPLMMVLFILMVVLTTYYLIRLRRAKQNVHYVIQENPSGSRFFDPTIEEMKVPY